MKTEKEIKDKLKDLNRILEVMLINEYVSGWVCALLWVLGEDTCK